MKGKNSDKAEINKLLCKTLEDIKKFGKYSHDDKKEN